MQRKSILNYTYKWDIDIDKYVCMGYVKCLDMTLTNVFWGATSNVWTGH